MLTLHRLLYIEVVGVGGGGGRGYYISRGSRSLRNPVAISHIADHY